VIGTKNQEPRCQDPKKEGKRRLTPAGAKKKYKRIQKNKLASRKYKLKDFLDIRYPKTCWIPGNL
jgi:hypothetical protein